MPEVGLFAFQIDEIISAVKYIGCIPVVIAVGLVAHATYFRKDKKI